MNANLITYDVNELSLIFFVSFYIFSVWNSPGAPAAAAAAVVRNTFNYDLMGL